VVLKTPAGGCVEESNHVILLQQTQEDRENKNIEKAINPGFVDVVDGLKMEKKRVYNSADREEWTKRNILASKKLYDSQLKKLVSVCRNWDAALFLSEQKDEVRPLSLLRGRRLCFYRNTLYAHLFHGQLHAVDLLSLKVTVSQLKPR